MRRRISRPTAGATLSEVPTGYDDSRPLAHHGEHFLRGDPRSANQVRLGRTVSSTDHFEKIPRVVLCTGITSEHARQAGAKPPDATIKALTTCASITSLVPTGRKASACLPLIDRRIAFEIGAAQIAEDDPSMPWRLKRSSSAQPGQ